MSRDANRPYQVVAGEADASSTVQNPANLGYLRAINTVFDFSFDARDSNLRGNGIGAFFAIPLPFQILSLGVGVQHFWRGEQGDDGIPFEDAPFGKFTFGAALPLERWAPGLSIGVNGGALYSRRNELIGTGAGTLDVGLSWRANRFVSLALAVRNVNQMEVNRILTQDQSDSGIRPTHKTSAVFDPEIALRPGGKPSFELGFGMRVMPFGAADSDLGISNGFRLQPRGRVLLGFNGFRVYAEGERIGFMRQVNEEIAEDALRMTLGVQFDTPHFGMSAGTNLAAGTDTMNGVTGGNGRFRISGERYRNVVELRPRKVMRLALAKYGGERGTARLVFQIDELTRLGAGALLLDARRGANTYAQIEEIREALLRFRSAGGKVATFINGGSTRTYFLASVSNRIYAQPGSELSIVGVTLRVVYWGDLLKKLGVESDFVRIAEYKGAAETYARKTASPPVAAQREMLLMDAWNHVLRSIANERGHQPRELAAWINEAPLTPERALSLGLVDELLYADELDEALESWFRRRVRIESPSAAPRRAGDWGKQAHVAVLYVDGDLIDGKSSVLPLVGTRLAGAETITGELRKLRKDPNVRALVLRVASRGGSVSAARSIAHELDLTREVKPVIVSFGAVAASGGYWIATGGDYIFSDAMTTTGSIGIFYPKMDLSGLLEKFGIGVDLVSFGEHAHMRSWFKAYGEDEREAAQASIQHSYEEFTRRVAKARSMSPEQVDAVARGRVWSGVRAIDRGLVDAYGGLREAILRARRVAKLPSNAPAYAYPPPPSVLEQIKSLFGLRIPRIGRASAMVGEDGIAIAAGSGRGRVLGGTRQVPPELTGSPFMRVLAQIPPSLWLLDAPESMALSEYEWALE